MSEREVPTVRPLRDGDLDAVVRIHRSSFPEYHSTLLGAGFCRRLFQAYATTPTSVVLVSTDGGGVVVGYLVGAPPADQRRTNDRLVGWSVWAAATTALRAPRAAAVALPELLGRARRALGAMWSRVVRRRPGETAEATGAGGDVDLVADVRVVLVAVAEQGRGGGHVDALLDGFAGWARHGPNRWADLSVVADNVAACRAYERNGWRPGALEGSVPTRRYWLELHRSAPPDPTTLR